MLELTFGEQVKIVLNRKDMTIKQLAEMIEERTGKKTVSYTHLYTGGGSWYR